ncbi:MAG: hypothetical protein AAFV96_03420, partial [Pseudomonadota bacterium]
RFDAALDARFLVSRNAVDEPVDGEKAGPAARGLRAFGPRDDGRERAGGATGTGGRSPAARERPGRPIHHQPAH